ncbi:uncharacterized protein BcabD6B2_29260 [Babesia caballi]|uniref:Variant erythrocyte surface antigen-1, beta subunit n=1 Tax=Babesia caballi TaxID=5871 RepID=A0AAV4LWJ4_BABCB|nr:hypothetical protein, conserved [Babesia caballi]
MSASSKPLTECPSNLKEAIDWILRVTGKDGQTTGGGSGTAIGVLAKQVHNLLSDSSNGSVANGQVLDDVSLKALHKWLTNNKGCDDIKTLIESLAVGLATFIGYDGANGLIGVGGIAVSNDPLERLRDGVLGFLAGFLGQLKSLSDLTTHGAHIQNAITALNGGVGKGQEGFSTAIQGADSALQRVNGSVDIKNILTQLKTITSLKNQSTVNEFAGKVKEYFNGVLGAVTKDKGFSSGAPSQAKNYIETLKNSLGNLVDKVGQQLNDHSINVGNGALGGQQGLGGDIEKVRGANAYLHPSQLNTIRQPQAKALASAVYSATYHFLAQLQRQTYVSSYPYTATWSEALDMKICGMIFLGCLPLYFYGVTYLYWRCSGKNGWTALTFNGGRGGFDLKWYMQAMGFDPSALNVNKKGSEFVTTAFKGFDSLLNSDSNSTPRYFTYISELQNKVGASGYDLTRCSLVCLYTVAEMHFRRIQNLKTVKDTVFPHTIRDMLYWMAGLQFSPDYEYLLGHISNIFMNVLNKPPNTKESEPTLQIADSARDASQSLTPSYVKGYLAATCLYIPSLLSSIQGAEKSGASDEPFLHKLYSNGLKLMYPSGASLFNALCDYAYAIQFEFSFLYHMCATAYSYGYGWLYCRFGQGVHPLNDSSTPALSHLCAGYTCKGVSGCTHNNNSCKHHANQGSKCGQAGDQGSPLQAFLTDKLTGFCLKLPGSSKHMEKHPTGYMCHVPMGFDGHLRTDSKQGGNLNYILQPFCGGSTAPLRQLCENLLCISRRTPKTLADLFGFYWHLNRVWEKGVGPDGRIKIKDAIESTVECTIASIFAKRNATEMLSTAIGNLKGHCHEKNRAGIVSHKTNGVSSSDHNCKNTPADLWSLCESVTIADRHKDCRPAKCGGYLYPLTFSTGAVFGASDIFASTYLSWLVYMGEHFRDWLQDFLDEFNSLKCTNCKHDSNCIAHEPGKHSSDCKCPSIPRCSGVLPLFYAYGFSFGSANTLMGGGRGPNRGDEKTLRSCDKFSQQLAAAFPLRLHYNTYLTKSTTSCMP